MSDEQYMPPVMLMEMHPDAARTHEAVSEQIDSNPYLRRGTQQAALVVATWPKNSQEQPFLLIHKHRHGSTGGGDCKVFRASRVVEDELELPAQAAELAALARWQRMAAIQNMSQVRWSDLPEEMREALVAASRLDLQAAMSALRSEWRDELQSQAEERLEGFKMSAEAKAFEAGAAQAEAEDDAEFAAWIAAGAATIAVAAVAAAVRFRRA